MHPRLKDTTDESDFLEPKHITVEVLILHTYIRKENEPLHLYPFKNHKFHLKYSDVVESA